jgi:ElaB/YqjD/DUF883 family membrane-anchored ribosome-binding protein
LPARSSNATQPRKSNTMTTKSKNSELDATTEELRSLVREAEALLARSADNADDKVVELRDRLSDLIGSGRDRFDKVKAVAEEKLHGCDDYVRKHPYQAVGVAAGVGALVALLASRRAA